MKFKNVKINGKAMRQPIRYKYSSNIYMSKNSKGMHYNQRRINKKKMSETKSSKIQFSSKFAVSAKSFEDILRGVFK